MCDSGADPCPADIGLCGDVVMPKDLPFSKKAVAPFISEKTLDLHFKKHQESYVSKLNLWMEEHRRKLPCSSNVSGVTRLVLELPAGSAASNLASQVFNHALYFSILGGGEPLFYASALMVVINRDFGNFDEFWVRFKARALAHFGSGWVWLLHNRTADRLLIVDTHDAETPIASDNSIVPLLVCDVWEHAYYLDFQNRRHAYLEAFAKAVDWQVVDMRFWIGRVEFDTETLYPVFRV